MARPWLMPVCLCVGWSVGCAAVPAAPGGLEGTAPPAWRRVAVVAAPGLPVDAGLLDSLTEALRDAGAQITGPQSSEVLVICRMHPVPRWVEPIIDAGGQARWSSEHLRPRDTVRRVPPDWTPRLPRSRWLAIVRVDLIPGASGARPKEVSILIDATELDGSTLSRSDLRWLRRTLDAWAPPAASRPAPGGR